MSKLINTVKGIEEYFLGTSTHAFYNEQRKFYRKQAELMKDMKVYDDSREKINNPNSGDILCGKILPTLASTSGLVITLTNVLWPLKYPHDYTPLYTDTNIRNMLIGAGIIIVSEVYRNLYKEIIKTNKTKTRIEQAKFIDKHNLESKTN